MNDGMNDIFVKALIALIALSIGFFIGVIIAGNSWQRAAVKAGHAEYYLDINYNRQWSWKTNSNCL